jgi:hypothetical protein
LLLVAEDKADVACPDDDAHRLARQERRVRHPEGRPASTQIELQKPVVGIMARDRTFDHDRSVVGHREWQVESCQRIGNRSASARLAVFQQHQMIGQARDLLERVTDIQNGDVEFIVKALKIRQDLQLAFLVERRERLVEDERGLVSNARAMATRCRSPPGSAAGMRCNK